MVGQRGIGMAATLAALCLSCSGVALAQSSQQQNPPPAQQPADKKPAVQDLTLDTPAPPANAEEDAAYKAFAGEPDGKKRIELGEAFVLKYPQSRYRPPVYSNLTIAYLQEGNVQKMEEAGEKELAINPNDGQTLAILGQTIPRSWNPS